MTHTHTIDSVCDDALFSCFISTCVHVFVCLKTSFTAEEENEVDASPSYTEEIQMELLSHLFPPDIKLKNKYKSI